MCVYACVCVWVGGIGDAEQMLLSGRKVARAADYKKAAQRVREREKRERKGKRSVCVCVCQGNKEEVARGTERDR